MAPKACVAHGEWDGTAAAWRNYNDPPKEKSHLFEHMNGAGPFKLARWDKTGRYVLLERHDAYFRGPAKLKRVLIKSVPEINTRKLMLMAGDADLIETPRPYVSQLAGLGGVTIVDRLPRLSTDPALFFTVRINPAANPDIGSGRLDGEGIPPDFFGDPDVRRGFSYAFDYDAILRDTFKGTAERALGPLPPWVSGSDKERYLTTSRRPRSICARLRGDVYGRRGSDSRSPIIPAARCARPPHRSLRMGLSASTPSSASTCVGWIGRTSSTRPSAA